ncbi:MAG: hypothetical protein BAJALOKI1v1_1540001 [Promethearchaeota archaeon]|nr:MAG: hypothetical protein BAJALOKI1v1_1540001 [Candidatus Lokiarchaeota archaeon]
MYVIFKKTQKNEYKMNKQLMKLGLIVLLLLGLTLPISLIIIPQSSERFLPPPDFSEKHLANAQELGEQIIIDVGQYPKALDIADANNDGIPDCISANYLGWSASLLLWNATIENWNKISIPGNNASSDIEIADANNDGFNDIVIAHMCADTLVITWNDTTQTWNEGMNLFMGDMLHGVAVGDANNDGFNDIVVSNHVSESISIRYWNEELGEWEPPISKSVGSEPTDVCIADINHDTFNDIIVSNTLDDSLSVFFWDTIAQDWKPEHVISLDTMPQGICIADANNDNFNDIIVAGYGSDSIYIFHWNESIEDWEFILEKTVGLNPYSVAVGDINEDGYNDLVASNEGEHTISLLYWNENMGNWEDHIRRNVGQTPRDVKIGDVNNDNVNDIVVANHDDNTVSIFLGEESAPPTLDEALTDQLVAFGDVFYYDVNASDPSGIDHYWLTGTTSFTINNEGIITNSSLLSIGDYWFTIHVNDTLGYERSCVLRVSVQDIEKQTSDIIDEMLAKYLNEYNSYGYFPSHYQSSLQGIYYTLSVLNATEQLVQVNFEEITDIIMSYYDSAAELFMDAYATRYLDTDFDLEYYPLNTLLEVNCYAILSLELLGKLDVIEPQKSDFIDFIWSCFDPAEGGYIGQPYNESLHSNFKVASLDNTYFAVKTLDALIDSWTEYNGERTQIVTFIEDCQIFNLAFDFYGGFENDLDPTFRSLRVFGPNMLSSYYALKTLEVFGMQETINIEAFHTCLAAAYHEEEDYFEFSELSPYPDYCIYSATALGLDLALMTEYQGQEFNATEILNFLLNSRNEVGIWDSTPYYNFYELIDTFQITRSLKECEGMKNLTLPDKLTIAGAMAYFKSMCGYSTTPREYTRIELLYSIIHSFSRYDRISELALQELYVAFSSAYYYLEGNEYKGFYGSITEQQDTVEYYRSYPIEFYSMSNHEHSEHIDYLVNHKFSYWVLTSLEKLFKLDDFAFANNLTKLLQSIERCQILEAQSNQFGAFVPFESWKERPLAHQEKIVFLEQTYFALKNIEYLMNYLELGNLASSNIDLDAVYVSLIQHMEETAQFQYYQPAYSNSPETILKNTYYAIETLLLIDHYSLNDQKIKNFVLQTLDYSNIENVYYCYKIDNLLNLDITFDVVKTHDLVHNIYSESEGELYVTPERTSMDPETFGWLTEMACEDDYRCEIDYFPQVQLNGQNKISISICNIILEELGPYANLKFESTQLGTHSFEKLLNNTYRYIANAPLDPNNYPMIYGNICIYEISEKVAEYPLSFNTFYEFSADFSLTNTSTDCQINIISNLTTASGVRPLYDGTAYIKLFYNQKYVKTFYLTRQEFVDHTEFMNSIALSTAGTYRVEAYVNDGIDSNDHYLGSSTFEYRGSSGSTSLSLLLIPTASSSTHTNNGIASGNTTTLFPLLIMLFAFPIGILAYVAYRKKKRYRP